MTDATPPQPDFAAIYDMTQSRSLLGRISTCANMLSQPLGWAEKNILDICRSDGWDTAWKAAKSDPNAGNYNQDTGVRTDVITNEMIYDGVSTVIATQTPPVAADPAADGAPA